MNIQGRQNADSNLNLQRLIRSKKDGGGYISINDYASLWQKKAGSGPKLVGRLNGHYMSMKSLRNLV